MSWSHLLNKKIELFILIKLYLCNQSHQNILNIKIADEQCIVSNWREKQDILTVEKGV